MKEARGHDCCGQFITYLLSKIWHAFKTVRDVITEEGFIRNYSQYSTFKVT